MPLRRVGLAGLLLDVGRTQEAAEVLERMSPPSRQDLVRALAAFDGATAKSDDDGENGEGGGERAVLHGVSVPVVRLGVGTNRVGVRVLDVDGIDDDGLFPAPARFFRMGGGPGTLVVWDVGLGAGANAMAAIPVPPATSPLPNP